MIILVYSYNPGSIWFSRHNGPTCCIVFIMYWLWNYTYTLMKCGQSLWNCFAPYYEILQWWRRDRTVSSIIFSVFGSLRSFLIFRTEYIYIYIKIDISAQLSNMASRQYVESKITPWFVGGSLFGQIEWSPSLIDISRLSFNFSSVVMIKSSVLSSFNLKKLFFIHIRMSAKHESIGDMAS